MINIDKVSIQPQVVCDRVLLIIDTRENSISTNLMLKLQCVIRMLNIMLLSCDNYLSFFFIYVGINKSVKESGLSNCIPLKR